ncbi:MAG: hypothetical protein Fues2KO_52150 [Fuerstiella sp.]
MSKTDFTMFCQQFFGNASLADNFTVAGTPAAATNEAAVEFTDGDAIHFGGNLQIDPTMLKKIVAELHVANTAGGAADPNSVPANVRVFFGLIGAAYNADPVANISKYILFLVEDAAETQEIRCVASDGTNTYDETVRLLDERSREYEIDLNGGVGDVMMRVGGKPAHNVHTKLDLSKLTASDKMQPVLAVVGLNCTLKLSQIFAEGRRSLRK